MEKIRFGLIGCGVMGESLATECNKLDQAIITAVSDVNSVQASKVGSDLDVEHHTDYQELLARYDVDAVLIAVPGFLHPDIGVAAADAGNHVFCEKPLAITLEGCDAIINACSRNNRKLSVGHVCRYHAIHSRVKQMVSDGLIGTPMSMVTRRLGGGWSGIWAQDWRTSRNKSGGTLMEVNAHELDFMCWVCGPVKRVSAVGENLIPESSDFEDLMFVNLEFENGAIGHLHSSSISTIGEYGGRVDGTEGSLNFPSIWGENSGIYHHRDDMDETSFLPGAEITVPSPVREEIRVFTESIINETEPPVSGLDGRRVVEVALAAYKSAASGLPVSLPLDS